MAKTMTYKEFEAYAYKYYDRGGDSYYECWDEKTYLDFYPNGITKSEALKMFARNLDCERDMAGYWM